MTNNKELVLIKYKDLLKEIYRLQRIVEACLGSTRYSPMFVMLLDKQLVIMKSYADILKEIYDKWED